VQQREIHGEIDDRDDGDADDEHRDDRALAAAQLGGQVCASFQPP
jgi:hypothetical protein